MPLPPPGLLLLALLGGPSLGQEEPPPENCAAPGTAPGPDGTCQAPRVWLLAGPSPRLGPPSLESFKLKRNFGQPDISREQLLKGELPAGRVELRSLFISVDPTNSNCQKFHPEHTPCLTYTVAEITHCSGSCKYPVGTKVMTTLFWKEVQIWPEEELPKVTPTGKVLVLPDPLPKGVKASHYLGVLGMPGWTAYSGLFRIGNMTCPGETVLITGAAGVVGAMLGQMAKIMGCRVVGTAGSDEKVAHLKGLGFDGAINYKKVNTVEAMEAALKAASPKGYDFYFDNTAGFVTKAAWPLLNNNARVAISGGIAHYYSIPPWWHHGVWYKDLPLEPDGSEPLGPGTHMGGPPVATTSRGRRIVVQGLGWPQLHQQQPYEEEFYRKVPQWISEGKLKVDETILEGFERLPEAFVGLFKGSNTGKMVVKVNWPQK